MCELSPASPRASQAFFLKPLAFTPERHRISDAFPDLIPHTLNMCSAPREAFHPLISLSAQCLTYSVRKHTGLPPQLFTRGFSPALTP